MYNSAKNNTMYSNVYPSEIGKVADFQTNGELTFNLPNDSTTFVAKASSIKSYPNGDYTWYGDLTGEEHGTVLLVEKDGRLDGRIGVDDEVYLIQSLSEGKNILLDVDESNFTEEECEVLLGGNSNNIPNESSVEIREDCEDLPVRVLVLYTPAAAEKCTPSTTANIAIVQLNKILHNSAIYSNDLQFSLAGVEELNIVEGSGAVFDAARFNSIATPVSQVAMDIIALQELHESDIAVVFTAGAYGNTVGAAYIGSGISGAVAVVQIEAAISKFTFAHEVGHILGGRHQQCALYSTSSCDDTPDDAHGYGWGEQTGNWPFNKYKNYATVMHQLRNLNVNNKKNKRIMNYSNPDVFRNNNSNYPTGGAGTNDVANVFKLGACAVAQYRSYDFVAPLSAYITGVNYVDNPGPFTWAAQFQGGTGPYNFQWSYSTDGFNYTVNTSQTGSTLTMLMPSGNYEDLYLRLAVLDASGDIVTAFYQVDYASDCDPCFDDDDPDAFQSSFSNDIEVGKILQVYPNLASDFIQITFDVKKEEEGNVSVALLDLSGTIIQNIPQGYLKEGSYFMNMSLKNTASELHIIKVQKGNEIETKKLFITH